MAQGLGSKALAAVSWGAGGALARMLLQIGSQVVLARLLGPSEYGLFAIGAIVVSFSGFFSDVGLAYGLIQKKEVSAADVRFVFTWQLILGTAVTAAIWLAAAPIAGFFGNVRSAGVVQALAPVCLLNALAAPSLNLLKRGLDFKRIQLAQLLGYVLGYLCVGIPLALWRPSVDALVLAWLVQTLVSGLLLYAGPRHALKPLLWYEQARAQSAYGATVFFTNILNWAINNTDRVFIGRLFPAREIGLYATTYNMLYNPTSTLLGVLQPVFFSASARIAEGSDGGVTAEAASRARIAQGFSALVAAIACFILPLFAALAALAPTFILVLYGDKWLGAAEVCRPLALAMPLFLIWGMATPLLWAGGKPGREFRVQAPVALAWALSCWLLAPYGIAALAWGTLGLFALRCSVVVFSALRTMQMGAGALWHSLRGGLLLTVLAVVEVLLLERGLAGLPALARLALIAVLATALHLAALRLLPWIIPLPLQSVLEQVLRKLPAKLSKRMAFLAGKRV
ncbi:oligosaccharide flippase family protein [Paucibacter sp. APW11]|uniref:Oligosaccharide flippase family protein n=1 Tax=Roseateles aquae TaxID=3077235 RepID=A0ABU3PFI8_9BURK|nr:oligosaccharide flippase family protein [Paucibacter sp. APW11]MDT9001328.1 oligosaccharide flippase family protein [Paucibacter sp. APW11]